MSFQNDHFGVMLHGAPPVPQDLLPATDTEAESRGQLCLLQLPGQASAPSQSAWCSVTNLVAVALAPEPLPSSCSDSGGSGGGGGAGAGAGAGSGSGGVSRILLLEPSNPEDCTALELPAEGPGDRVTGLCWSWPGQRRALLSATAAGRVVVWTQQGQDDAVLPRCIDEWHGQLLCDTARPQQGAGSAQGQGAGAGTGSGAARGGAASVKQEPGLDGAEEHGAGGLAAGAGPGPGLWEMTEAALAAVCWLRQPPGGRFWSTSALAAKRLGAAAAGQQPGQVESFDSIFCGPDAPIPGAVPHWARSHQLTAATLTRTGTLTLLWASASKLSNTAAWHRSQHIHVPPPDALAAANGHAKPEEPASGTSPTAATPASPGSATVAAPAVACAALCAAHDGTLVIAVVYGSQREVLYVYRMSGNPTLGGQPLQQPGAAAAAVSAAAAREAPPPTVVLQAALSLPPGLHARQCALHHCGTALRAYVLAEHAANPHGLANGLTGHNHHHHHTRDTVAVVGFVEEVVGPHAGAGWRPMPQHVVQLQPQHQQGPDQVAAGFGAAIPGGCVGSAAPSLCVSCDGSKLAVAAGGAAHCLDAETLAVLRSQNLADGYTAQDDAVLLAAEPAAPQDPGLSAPALPRPTVRAATTCLSANACCLCSVALVARAPHPHPQHEGHEGHRPGRSRSRHRGADALPNGDTTAPDADGSGDSGSDGEGGGGAAGGIGGPMVLLSICTTPDVAPPVATAGQASGGGAVGTEEAAAVTLDTLRLAWALLHRLSMWDVTERLRSCWLSGRAGRAHVCRTLDVLDELMYGTEDVNVRMALGSGISRAKLCVLRRLPDPLAAVVAQDLLAAARLVQCSQLLSLVHMQPAEAFSHPETRALVAHAVWYVLELQVLMLAGLKMWAEAAEQQQQQQQQGQGGEASGGGAAGAAPGDSSALSPTDLLPLVRLFQEYPLSKHAQSVLLGYGHGQGGKGAPGGSTLGLHPEVLALLGGPEVAQRVRTLLLLTTTMQKAAMRGLGGHLQALWQQQGGPPLANLPGGGSVPPALLPGAPRLTVAQEDVEVLAKTGDLTKSLMTQALPRVFPGYFRLHYCRAKYVLTPGIVLQILRQEEASRHLPLITLSREALLERHRQLGLAAPLTAPGSAPHAAARRLWMRFRSPAPPPSLHAHVLSSHVSGRQRQRWRRQRAAALAVGASAPLWSHAQGGLVDCLTGVPLLPGASWALEGAGAVGAVTAQMGPGVGAAGSRRALPPLLAALQRAWVCCAAPAELGAPWKRARLGVEADMEY